MADVLHAEMGGIDMKTEDLYLEYARVIKMCEGTEVKPRDCVKFSGLDIFGDHPAFDCVPNDYEFAVAILEGKPVFIGDTVFHKQSGIERIINTSYLVKDFEDNFTWQQPKPKRAFMLNGVELPCPDKESRLHPFDISGRVFYFKSPQDRNDVFNAILNMLIEARNKQ